MKIVLLTQEIRLRLKFDGCTCLRLLQRDDGDYQNNITFEAVFDNDPRNDHGKLLHLDSEEILQLINNHRLNVFVLIKSSKPQLDLFAG